MDEESRKYTTINTHRGLFRYNRLPFGISSAPAIFQRTTDSLLQGVPHVAVFLGDILITGKDTQEHLQNEAGLRLKRSKCKFLTPEVVYLGHKITKEGTDGKVKEFPTPADRFRNA